MILPKNFCDRCAMRQQIQHIFYGQARAFDNGLTSHDFWIDGNALKKFLFRHFFTFLRFCELYSLYLSKAKLTD